MILFDRRAILPIVAVMSISITLLFGCKTKHEQEGYRVVGYDSTSHRWTIIRNGTFDGKYMEKKLVVVCMFYKWGDHDAVDGPDACHLQVGRLFVPSLGSGMAAKGQFISVFEMPNETLSITEGEGADRIMQQFYILSYSVSNP